jgi:hypothetical protein
MGDHGLHLGHFLQNALALSVGHIFHAETQARERRAQIVADRAHHRGAIIHKGAQAVAHLVEGIGRAADLGGPESGRMVAEGSRPSVSAASAKPSAGARCAAQTARPAG